MKNRTPVVGVTCCIKYCQENRAYHAVGLKYVQSVVEAVGAIPLLIPAVGSLADIPSLLDRLDGLLLTGSVSNVEPHHYGDSLAPSNNHSDPDRDSLTLPLIRRAMEQKKPLFAICRGMQELNVALGGTLHQEIKDLPGKMKHTSREDASALEEKYEPAHAVTFTPGGLLQRLTGRSETKVNSLHQQGIRDLAPGLAVEAVAPDGIIEAVTAANSEGFVLGVQWHPEWLCDYEDGVSRCLFSAFRASL